MSRPRLIFATCTAAALLVLLAWQLHRERQIAACLDNGGTWTGTGCGPLKLRPILQRDLRRL
jgi:hypothetical protein